jgi:hypothetical protein
MKLFKRRKTRLVTFYTGTKGLEEHRQFINTAADRGIKILHAYTLYHDYNNSHEPATLNYVITYKE